MLFCVLGTDWHLTNLDERVSLSLENEDTRLFTAIKSLGITQMLMLSTCNRVEIYYMIEDETKESSILECLQSVFGFCEGKCYYNKNRSAIEHALAVACGLRSRIVGEDQILGQMSRALAQYRVHGLIGKELDFLFRHIIHCARELKSSAKIGEIPLSVAYVALRMAEEMWSLYEKHILILGSGDTVSLLLSYLPMYHPKSITICCRNMHKASRELQHQCDDIRDIRERYALLSSHDICISASSAQHTLIQAELLTIHRSLKFIDLAFPRDIEKNVADNPDIELVDLDQIHLRITENDQKRRELATLLEGNIATYCEKIEEGLSLLAMDSRIESLQHQCERIVGDSMQYLERKISLTERERGIIERTLASSLQRLISSPIHALKQERDSTKQSDFVESFDLLFDFQEK